MAHDKYPFCERHNKYAYVSNAQAADSAIRVLSFRRRFALRIYPCRINGVRTGAWHLTKKVRWQ